MKVNFYISCETDEEMQACLEFMRNMTAKRKELEPFPYTGPGSVMPATLTQSDRPNVSPGKSSITKIGADTKKMMLDQLRAGSAVAQKYEEHLKLLWSRGEVKYDGDQYYL